MWWRHSWWSRNPIQAKCQRRKRSQQLWIAKHQSSILSNYSEWGLYCAWGISEGCTWACLHIHGSELLGPKFPENAKRITTRHVASAPFFLFARVWRRRLTVWSEAQTHCHLTDWEKLSAYWRIEDQNFVLTQRLRSRLGAASSMVSPTRELIFSTSFRMSKIATAYSPRPKPSIIALNVFLEALVFSRNLTRALARISTQPLIASFRLYRGS